MTVLQTTLVDTPSEEWRLAIVAPLTIFGAEGFYQKLGYDVFGTLDDYPVGFKMTFLKKDLRL